MINPSQLMKLRDSSLRFLQKSEAYFNKDMKPLSFQSLEDIEKSAIKTLIVNDYTMSDARRVDATFPGFNAVYSLFNDDSTKLLSITDVRTKTKYILDEEEQIVSVRKGVDGKNIEVLSLVRERNLWLYSQPLTIYPNVLMTETGSFRTFS